ncbi:MAG: pseudaminic acid cytidylyltransferase [Deltaproteobacteria bacterium]|jgi:pseudaminic acid cytidylyltransferase|nr:pseudaminic acid cytidylyltransferase [Deltaproteobacteria bacterium]
MINNKVIAIIPARAGSKRIPNKNIKSFAGQPIISYSIKAAQETNLFDRIIVSTDSEKIAEVAKTYGAEAPFIRPAELSDDFTGTDAVVLHALKCLLDSGEKVNYVCCIYATAPFVRSEDIHRGFELLRDYNATSTFTVTSFPSPIFRALKINDSGRIDMFWPQYLNTRSQDLPEAYHDAGQFYWADVNKYLQRGRFYSNDSVPVVLRRYFVQDIDTLEDWETAEKMYSVLQMDKIC